MNTETTLPSENDDIENHLIEPENKNSLPNTIRNNNEQKIDESSSLPPPHLLQLPHFQTYQPVRQQTDEDNQEPQEQQQEEEQEEWLESTDGRPLSFVNLHLFEQIDLKGRYKNPKIASQKPQDDPEKLMYTRVPLHITFSVTDILKIDPVEETFVIKYRLFLFWELNASQEACLSSLLLKAKETGHYYQLNRQEVDEFLLKCYFPRIAVFNKVSTEETDVLDIRIYGGENGKTGILANQGYLTTCKERFSLREFPFDLQYLTVDICLHDSTSWNTYRLIIDNVQFYNRAFHQLEWLFLIPQVERGNRRYTNSVIKMPVLRRSNYYISNIIVILIILTLLGLSTFAFESADLTGRTFIGITLILTTIAFKFTAVLDSLPKVSYSTLMDQYISFSIWCLALMTVFTIIPSFYVDEETHRDEKINAGLAYASIALIVSGFSYLGLRSYFAYTKYRIDCCLIPLDQDDKKPWYAFRYATPKHLVPLDRSVSVHDSMQEKFTGNKETISGKSSTSSYKKLI